MWKLHSFEEYMAVILIFAAGFIAIFLYTRHLNSKRNDAYAKKSVNRKLKSLIHKGRVYSDVSFPNSSNDSAAKPVTVDHFIIDKKGLLLIKTFGFGLWIKGGSSDTYWYLCDRKNQIEIPNPLSELESASKYIQGKLKTIGLEDIPISKLIILADIFERTVVPKWSNNIIALQNLKPWYKSRIKSENTPNYISIDYIRMAELLMVK